MSEQSLALSQNWQQVDRNGDQQIDESEFNAFQSQQQ